LKFISRVSAVAVLLSCLALAVAAQSQQSTQSSNDAIAAKAIKTLLPTAADGNCTLATAADDSTGHGLDLSNLDRSVKPCDNFFQFADGGWLKSHPIPPEYPSYGSFTALQESNRDKLHTILEAAAKKTAAAPGSIDQKIGDFYFSCMDEAAIEKAGIDPIRDYLARIDKISSVAELQAEIIDLQGAGSGVVFFFGSQPDFKNSSMTIGSAGQGGIGLPDRDYYLKADERSVKLREAYVQHVTNMFVLLGDDPGKAAAEAKTVLALETKLAQASMARVDRRDPDKTYHMMDRAALKALTPDFDWNAYFRAVGQDSIVSINVAQPDFFRAVDHELTATPLDDWKTYLRWHLINGAGDSLSKKFVDEDFNFFGRTLTGAQEIQVRWKRCVRATDGALGEALGQIYVKDYFPPEAKAAALQMVKNLTAALREDISTLDWMSEATRKKAIEKLDAIQLKIGYPDKWRDYSAFKVDRGVYALNAVRGIEFERQYRLAKIGKPVDRKEWGMTPPTVNAYYSSTINEIVFPAGILQPPFYDPKRDDAMNYGGMGAVIGHEMTHGFDDQGAKFDAVGNRSDWWTPEDLKNFQARGDCVAKQFDSYVVEEGLHENGKLVEGESIADFGGLTISFAALQKVLAAKPSPGLIDGFTPEQRFFLAWAEVWAGSDRPEFARLLVNTNPHPLNRFRGNGPLGNMPAFQKAWGCGDGDPMIRPAADRCRIW
jgi:putative endopeptidase